MMVGLKFFFPPKRARQYIKIIKKSKLFDRKYYRRNTKLTYLQKRMPIRHYVLIGEQQNARPTYYFAPDIYQKKYLTETPFLHYITVGKQAGNNCAWDFQNFHYPSLENFKFTSPKNIAIVIHIHYPELWVELEKYLARCDYNYDLFCTISCNEPDTLINSIKEFKSQAVCITLPNHGRDIFPFIYLINQGLLDPYQAIIKAHTKKSLQKNIGSLWREQLLKSLFPPICTGKFLNEFISNDAWVGAVAPQQIKTGAEFWSNNKPKMETLLAKLNINIDHYPLRFPAGSMYILKQPIVQALKRLNLTYQDFQVENSQLDDTTAHAVERVIGYIAMDMDKEFVEI